MAACNETPPSTEVGSRSPLEDAPLPPVKSTACRRCHSRKVKCSGDQPCRNCRQAGKGTDCTYPRRNRQVKVRQSYIDGLLDEIQRLKGQIARHASCSACRRDEGATQSSRAGNGAATPLSGRDNDDDDEEAAAAAAAAAASAALEVKPWFINANVFRTPILIGEVADAAFSTRIRQVISDPFSPQPRHMLRVNYAPDTELMSLVKSEIAWPTPSRSRFLVEVALKYVSRRYHVVRRSLVMENLEQSIHNPSWGDLMLRSKLWALFAIGELYSTRSIPSEKEFPGMAYFAKASRILGVLDERPGTDSIEIMLLLSFYSLALNRRYSAFVMSGTAMRMAIVMGLHLNIPESQLRDPDLREHRKRLFWTTYIFDRVWASKLGHPTAIQDSDIGIDLPSEPVASQRFGDDFGDTAYHIASLRLAALVTKTVRSIYGQRNQGDATLSTRVQQALKDLRSWVEDLPSHLQIDNAGTGPTSISLHLSFNQCAILATRPILLHILRTKVNAWPSGSPATTETQQQQVPASAVTLSEACVRCARHSVRLLTDSWIDGSFATFDYFYTQYLFSALTVLAASSLLDGPGGGRGRGDGEAFEESARFLSQLGDAGNFAAREYRHHADVLRAEIEGFRAKRMGLPEAAVAAVREAAAAAAALPSHATAGMALTEPSLEELLAQPVLDLQFLEASFYDDLQGLYWPDFSTENWDTWAST
ncbi:fungal-specific transcription factor [Colletotrichum somersetense]|nr:fungal-specific transcription factor [Colletotrichum somersetense]